MKLSIELKGLVCGIVFSAGALGLAFGGGAWWRRAESVSSPPPVAAAGTPMPADVRQGRSLFLKNCAHCHGDDARGDEGPDLHGLHRSDEGIARRIRNGVKGEMTAFGEKFSQTDIDELIAYLRTLK
jgi:mono/diheme cytochrome c family protein